MQPAPFTLGSRAVGSDGRIGPDPGAEFPARKAKDGPGCKDVGPDLAH